MVGESVEGSPLELLDTGAGERVALFLATIHGDESAGTPLLRELAARLSAGAVDARGWRALVLPVANPDGLARGSRQNARGVDLNRNFPAANRVDGGRHGSALSEPEARAIHRLVLEHRPERIVSLHQAANQLDFDGGGEALARAMEAVSPLAVARMGARPGSLGSWAGEDLGRAVVTVEMTRADDRRSAEELWERYGAMLLAAFE